MKKQYVIHTYKEILTIIAMGALIALLSGCGKTNLGSANFNSLGACYSLISTGHWYDPTLPDTMVLNPDCSATTTYCNEKFTYQLQPDQTTVVLTVTQSNGGPQCNAVGTDVCTVTFSSGNSLMQFTCAFGTYQYQRQ